MTPIQALVGIALVILLALPLAVLINWIDRHRKFRKIIKAIEERKRAPICNLEMTPFALASERPRRAKRRPSNVVPINPKAAA